MRLVAVHTKDSCCMMKFLLAVLLLVTTSNAARILGIFPYPSHSHQTVFKALTEELVNKGHEVVIFTTHPDKEQRANYTQITLTSIVERKVDLNLFEMHKASSWTFLSYVYPFAAKATDYTLSHPAMQEILSPNNTQKFDLILAQALFFEGIYSVAHLLDIPLIGVSSLQTGTMQYYGLGNPFGIAYAPDVMLGYSSHMTFWERLINFYYVIRTIYEYEMISLPLQEKVVRKHFGHQFPSVHQLMDRMSLLMTSSRLYFHYPHPNMPSIIYMGGCRRQAVNKTIPEDIKQIFDKSKHGVIYFSMGTNVLSNFLPSEIKHLLLQAFAELPYTVLWKYESDDLIGKLPNNVITKKWVPQREVLAHPKTVLFMYQGGLQSTEEVTSIGLPIIGFPILSDQTSNLIRLGEYGVAKRMNILKLDKDDLKNTIVELITNPRYKENAIKLRDLLVDRPYHPLDHAIWWIEHVIRHKGADHIRNLSRDMPLYQTLLLDIFGLIALTLLVIIYCSILLIRFLIRSRKYLQRSLNFTSSIQSTKKQQ